MSHVLHLGDCLDPVSGLASLEDKSVDSVICDPPYEAEAHTLMRRTKSDLSGGKHVAGGDARRVVEAPLDFAAISEEQRLAVARECVRVSRRWLLFFCQAEAVQRWREAIEAAGGSYRRACVWVKPDAQPQLSGDRPGMGYESIVAGHIAGRSRWNGGGRPGVYVFNKNNSDPIRTGHPTQKPIALMEALVRDFTDPGEIILDPFAGSGTTGVACKRLGRSFIGWERDPKYAAIAERRIRDAREQLEIGMRVVKPKQEVML